VQLLPDRRTDERFVDEFTRVVGRGIVRMEGLVDRLRSLARPGQRPLHPVDVRQPLADALEYVQPAFNEKDVVVEHHPGNVEAKVLGDPGELEQLFLNLLINAKEATGPGGRVTIHLACTDDRVTVTVADTGIGVPPDMLERIFDPFVSTKERGSGLGLAICAGIADAHRARLRAENRPEGGARFTVDFPPATRVPTVVKS
jgi:two-component system NtrC family sensor kinase